MNKLLQMKINDGRKTNKRNPKIVVDDCSTNEASYPKTVNENPVKSPHTAIDVFTRKV